ncbi:MAG: SRPBCC family protein [Archangium sp.]|nr:SRPBCC family protein [Archangium sp.]
MAKKILGAVAVLIVIFLVVVATRPGTFEIKRSLLINAPAEVVYDQVDDFKSWNAWSPWDQMDPTMKRTFNEVPSGVGAGYAWVGNKDVGEGNMKITDAKPPEHLGLDLNFTAPFAANNRTDFDFAKTGEGTTVTWTMSGTNNFVSKAMSLFMDMDKMVGPDFEKGLASMKKVSEEAAAKQAADAKAAADAAAAPPAPVEAAVDAGTP